MPYSTTLYKAEIKQHFIDKLDTSIKILDVGAGCGTYAHLLKEDFYIMQLKYLNLILKDLV